MSDIGAMYLEEAIRSLHGIQRQADSAMQQLNDERSRFTDFLTSDGEKPDRNRDQEFPVALSASQ